MTKQEKIREGIEKICVFCKFDSDLVSGEIMMFLHKSDVVIKVERELPHCENFEWTSTEDWKDKFDAQAMRQFCVLCKAGYVAVEPLISED